MRVRVASGFALPSVIEVGEDLVVSMSTGQGSNRSITWFAGLAVLLLGLVLPSEGLAADDPPPRTGPQVVRPALDRVFATGNGEIDIDGVDDKRVDVDIAILDTGVQLDHPDLNIVEWTNCVGASSPTYACTSASSSDGDDDAAGIWHGSTSAAHIAAIDNSIGWVGIAPGARLWSVDISGNERYGWPLPNPLPSPSFDLESVIAGVKWVTAHSNEIEVVHLAMLCTPDYERSTLPPAAKPAPYCPDADEELVGEFEDAVAESIAKGVVYAFSAGEYYQTDKFVPQRFAHMLTSSQIADSDGLPGGLGGSICGASDDHSTATSSWGTGIDIAAPSCAGSHASTLVTGAAAILASQDNPNNQDDVDAIRNAIVAAGNSGWTDDSTDMTREPLLDVHDTTIFNPVMGRPFEMYRPGGIACDPYCDDTGYTGTLPGVTFAGTACQASFDVRMQLDGKLETRNTEVLCPNGSGGYYNVEECDHSWGPTRIVIPETGQPRFDLDICLRQGAWPQGVGGIEVNHNIRFAIYGGPRRWVQIGAGTVTDNDPNSGPFPAITGAVLQDGYTPDNTYAVFP